MLMTKVGILSGGGKLPLLIGKKLIQSKYDVMFFCIEKFSDLKLYKDYNFEIISINSLTRILNNLKKNKIEKIILVGKVKRPSIKDINFDFNSLKLIKNFALDSKGDDKLLSAISIFFENNGFPILDWKDQCRDLFINKKCLTLKKPSKESISNKDKGLNIFKLIGKTDIAQSLIIQNNIVLGIEAAEGTDELIKRCFEYKNRGDKGILIKLSKYNQHSNLDIPVIGIETVKKLKAYDYDGVFLEKNKCMIIDKDEVIKFSNANDIFIASVDKN